MRSLVLIYRSGEEIRKGDLVLFPQRSSLWRVIQMTLMPRGT
jgi:hypothetical protein